MKKSIINIKIQVSYMKYKNVVIETLKKTVYHCISIDNNNKVRILETNSFGENTTIEINQKNKKFKTMLLVPHTHLLLRQVTLPKISEDSIYNAAKFSLEEFYPGENIKNYTIGYFITNSDNKNIYLVVWGIKKSVLQGLLNKYSGFDIEYVFPTFTLPMFYFHNTKTKDCMGISFLYPNEVVFLTYGDYLKNITVRNFSESFYSYEELKSQSQDVLVTFVTTFLKFCGLGNNVKLSLFPYIDNLSEGLTIKGYNVDGQNQGQGESGITYFDGIASVSDKESLLKEEFKKVEPYVKTLYHILFLMVIMLFTLAPLYYIKRYDYNKNKTDINKVREEFTVLYKKATNNDWESFNKSYDEVKQKISDLEDSLGASSNFPIQSSSLDILKKVLLIPQVKDIAISKFTINIAQKNFIIKSLTLKREAIESIIESLKSQDFDAKLNGSVILKEDGSLEFEIVIKW